MSASGTSSTSSRRETNSSPLTVAPALIAPASADTEATSEAFTVADTIPVSVSKLPSRPEASVWRPPVVPPKLPSTKLSPLLKVRSAVT